MGEEEVDLPECLGRHEHGNGLARMETWSALQGRERVSGRGEDGGAED